MRLLTIALFALIAVSSTACALRKGAASGCFQITAVPSVVHPRHPVAISLLSTSHGGDNPQRFRLRLPLDYSPEAPKYWEITADGLLHVHVMGGFAWVTTSGFAAHRMGMRAPIGTPQTSATAPSTTSNCGRSAVTHRTGIAVVREHGPIGQACRRILSAAASSA